MTEITKDSTQADSDSDHEAEERERQKEKEKQRQSLLIPHLKNLNEDPLLSGKIIYPLTETTLIGRKNGNPVP